MAQDVVARVRKQFTEAGRVYVGPLSKRPSWRAGSEIALHIATDSTGAVGLISLWDGFTWQSVGLLPAAE